MASYDTNSTLGQPVFGPRDTQIPFTVTCRIVTAESGGRRMTTQRSGQMTANMVQSDLIDAGWNIATPVAYVPAFGSSTARITLNGFFVRDVGGTDQTDDLSVFVPTEPVTKIASGTVPGEKTSIITGDGGGGNLSYGQEPVAQTNTLVYELINSLQMDSSLIGTVAIIEKIDLMGVKYGKDARSFPN